MKDANVFVSSYILSIFEKSGIKKQFISSTREYNECGDIDPLCEKHFSKKQGLIHRYPDRVVLTVTNRCFAYCKFCFRKKNWQKFEGFDLEGSIDYIKKHKRIREVLISGGDPFYLRDGDLENILSKLRSIEHIKFIRIGTRVLSSNPMRINHNTVKILSRYKPLWIAAHINHPDEITKEFKTSARLFVDAGIPVVSQSVLLKNINDNTDLLEKMFCLLVEIGIKPYYLFGCDQAFGNEKFRVSIHSALNIMKQLRGKISGLCMPNFAFDLPDGGGKVVVEPNRLLKKKGNIYTFENFEDKRYDYVDV
jgi:lysine 2,3-aminomutase